jgi:hypothetical protein
MRPSPLLIPLVLSCALLIAQSAPPPSRGGGAKLLDAAHRLVASIQSSSYEHKTDIDESAGRFNCDCSGLVGYLLKKHLPSHYAVLPTKPENKRPTAEAMHDYFMSLPKTGPWTRIDKLTDVRPGDVIAWRHIDPKPGSTGHVVIADGSPVREGNQYRLTIIDSAKSGHANDTRKPGQSGVGRGDVFITTDPAGRPTGYRWSKPDGDLRSESIVIARPR